LIPTAPDGGATRSFSAPFDEVVEGTQSDSSGRLSTEQDARLDNATDQQLRINPPVPLQKMNEKFEIYFSERDDSNWWAWSTHFPRRV
jgi:hypothetical protein